jgi:hypothetical protein
MKKQLIKGIYLNQKQIKFLEGPQKRKCFNAGRGSGKSYTIGHWNIKKFLGMPQAKSLLVAQTFYQLLTKTISQMEQAFQGWGWREWDSKTGDGVWTFGKKPPSHWVRPHQPIRAYDYCYSFINGYTIELGSMEQKDRIRGGSYDALDADESATIDEDAWNKIIIPTIRGINNGPKNINSPLRYSICDFTTAPWSLDGKWIYKTRELAKLRPKDYLFVEASTLENVDVLTQEYIDMLQRTLTPLEYYVEVLNKEIDKSPDGGFYPAFSKSKHLKSDVWDYDWDSNGRMTIKRENFIDPALPFIFSLDFNVKFTSGIICQEATLPSYREFRVCDVLFERPDPMKNLDNESPLLIDRLVDAFCVKYAHHPIKYIEIDGDASGKNNRVGAPAIFEQVKARFRHHGWQAVIKAINRLPEHKARYILINNILRGGNPKYPKIVFNEHTTKALVMSITFAPVTPDFQKDKSSERQNIDQIQATHLSDCFDYVLCRKYGGLLDVGSVNLWSSLIGNR